MKDSKYFQFITQRFSTGILLHTRMVKMDVCYHISLNFSCGDSNTEIFGRKRYLNGKILLRIVDLFRPQADKWVQG